MSKLAGILPSYASVSNPIDMTSVLRTESELFGQVLDVVVQPEVADLFVIGFPASGPGYDVAGLVRMTNDIFTERALPVAVAIPQASIARHFHAAGIPTFSSETEALKALLQLALHTDLMSRQPGAVSPGPTITPYPGDSRFLSEAQSLQFLVEQGLPVVAHEVCDSQESACEAMQRLAVPVVLKASSPEIQHKTEHGLVHLDIIDEAGLIDAFDRMETKMKSMAVEPDGIIVASMAGHRWELMVGVRVDPVYGPVVVAGEGGRYVEASDSLVTLMPPFPPDEMLSAIRSLPRALIWDGVRGEPGADLEAFATLACRVGDLVLHSDGITSIDLNPVLVGAPGEGVLIADALIERS